MSHGRQESSKRPSHQLARKSRWSTSGLSAHCRRLVLEPLEDRRLLSGKGVEVGSAVFRDGVLGGFEWHAALYWMHDGYTNQDLVIQENGTEAVEATWDDFLSTNVFGQPNAYQGSRELSGVAVNDFQRQELAYQALWQLNAPYTYRSDTYSHNTEWQSGDGSFRCDTLVQYVYQTVLGQDFNTGIGTQTPHGMFNVSNASPVTITSPTATVSCSWAEGGNIVIDFSEMMSRGTLDPSSDYFCNSVSLVGSVAGQYVLSSADVVSATDPVASVQFAADSNFDHELFDYTDSTQHSHQCANEMIICPPKGGFVPGETLTLTISGAAEDLGGNAFLGKSFVLQVPSLPDQPPHIGSLGVSPNPVVLGNNLNLTASNVTDSDGTVAAVGFYRDVNGNNSIDRGTDQFLGLGTQSGTTWTWTGSTSGFPTGTNTYMAWAEDNVYVYSNTVTSIGTVNSPTGTQPVITNVTPPTLIPLPIDQRQLITVSGTGFNAGSTLNFISALGSSYTGRVPTYDPTSGTLGYYISVGTAQGQWTVQVVTYGVASDPYTFMVSTAAPVATPTISPNGGSYSNSIQVTLSTSTAGAALHYTLDGSDPTTASPLYVSALTLSNSVTLKARGFASGIPNSSVASASFTVTATPAAPAITSVSPSVLQPSTNIQTISIYGSGFLSGCLLYFYDPSGNLVQNNQTVYLTSGWLDYGLNVSAKSGTWTVKVVNDPYGSPKPSNVFSFTVAQPPSGNYPIQSSPANGTVGITGQPVLTWQAIAGANYYRVMVAGAPDLPRDPNAYGNNSSDPTWVSTTSALQMTIGGNLAPGKTYYWQVQASINGVKNAWSPIWAYTMAGELNLPPVVQSGGVTPSTITQGDPITFTASGVSDPNLPPDHVKQVFWYVESNGVPGLQTSFPNGDSSVVDNDGSDGWSFTWPTFGQIPPYGPFTVGTHTLYTVAVDTHGAISASAPLVTFTVLPANLPAPTIQSMEVDPSASPAQVQLHFNVDVGPSLSPGEFLFEGQFPQSVTYDPVSNTATVTLNQTQFTNGDHVLLVSYSSGIYNVAGVQLQGPTSFPFSVLYGDANGDRTVDSQDYTILEQNLNTGSDNGWGDGDFNGDSVVDAADLQILQANMGQSLPTLAGAPNKPVNTSPGGNTNGVALPVTLQASAFSPSVAGDTQAASQWVVTRVSDSMVVFNSGEDQLDKTSICVPSLAYSTSYSWKIRFRGNFGVWSAYSDPTTFTTAACATTTAVTSSNGSSTYGQAVTFTATVTPSSGIGPGGTVQFQIDGSNAGSPVAVSSGAAAYTTSTLAVGSHSVVAVYSGDGNFAGGTSPTFNESVGKATPTITWGTPAAMTYGTALSGTQLNANASVAGTFSYSAAMGTVLPAGIQTLSVTFTPTDTTDFAAATATATVAVSPALLTASITIGNRCYDGTCTAAITGRSLSGVIGSDDVSLIGGTANFADKNVGAGKTVTVTGLSLSGSAASNYIVNTTASATASITPAPLTAFVVIGSKVYDGTATATITDKFLNGVMRLDEVGLTAGIAAFADKNAGTDKVVTATGLAITGTDADNYLVNSTVTATANITPALLTVTADDKSRTYCDPNPTFSASYAGFKNGELLSTSGVTGNPSLDCIATADSLAGSYSIVAGLGTLTAENYTFTFVDGTLTVLPDITPPTATIDQASGQADPANGSPINFTVVFSEPVSDFTAGDVTLGGTAGATTAIVTGSGTTYNVAVSGMTGDGTVIATIAAGKAHDAAGNANSAATSIDNAVGYDATPPMVTINQAAGQADPTGASPINVTVVFSEPVNDFASGDITLGGTAGGTTELITNPSGDQMTYNVAVSGMTGDGTVIATIAAGVAHDLAGNPSSAATSSDNEVAYDATPPTVTINQSAGQPDPATSGPIYFTVVFSEAVGDFTSGDVIVGGTAPGALVATVTEITGVSITSGTTYFVAVSGMTGNGTVSVSLPGGVAHDAAGNANLASTSTDNSVTYAPSSGDFNGNSLSDVLLHNQTTGEVGAWLVNAGSTPNGWKSMGAAPASTWQVVGVGDFDGNGLADVLLHNQSTGEVGAWLLQPGGAPNGWKSMGAAPASAWKVVGVGDFDGNGLADVLLHNQSSGEVGAWLLQSGGAPNGWKTMGAAPASTWTVVGVGDFDGNELSDVLLHNQTSGEVGAWLLQGGGAANGWKTMGAAPAKTWKVAGVGDFDGNGLSDVLLHNQSSGEVGAWLLQSGGAANGWKTMGGAPATMWKVVGVGDYDGNGLSDVLLHNQTSGDVGAWLLQPAGVPNGWRSMGNAPATTWKVVPGDVSGLQAVAAATDATSQVATLMQGDLQPIVAEALARWASAGLDASTLARLAQVQFVISDLPGSYLGEADGAMIRLDGNAAGHGWFVDPTPALDEEFSPTARAGQLQAIDPRAVDRIDLLTVVEHELGHVAGFDDLDALADNLMSGILGTGVRREPYANGIDRALSST